MSNKFWGGVVAFGLFLITFCFAAGLQAGGMMLVAGLYLLLSGLVYGMPSAWQATFSAWIARNPWLFASGVLLGTCVFAYTVWAFSGSQLAVWVGRLTLIAGAFCFIKHGCVRRNWCTDFKAWWQREGHDMVVNAWRKIWSARIHLRNGVRGGARVVGPFIASNILPITAVVAGLIAWEQYNDAKSLADHSWKFWLPAGIATVAFFAWSKFGRGVVVGFIRLCAGKIAHEAGEVWERFQKEVPAVWKGILFAIVGILLLIASSLIHGKLIRGQGWLHRELEVRMSHQNWSGILFILGVAAFSAVMVFIIGPDLFGHKTKKDAKKKPSKEEEKAEKRREADLEKLIRKYKGDEGVAAYRKAKKAGEKFSW